LLETHDTNPSARMMMPVVSRNVVIRRSMGRHGISFVLAFITRRWDCRFG
jgi:hypothetical protein